MADFSLTSKGETPVDSHSDENTSTTTRLKAVANGSISEARFLRELQRVRDEKTAAEDVFHKTLTQYETKIQHLEVKALCVYCLILLSRFDFLESSSFSFTFCAWARLFVCCRWQ